MNIENFGIQYQKDLLAKTPHSPPPRNVPKPFFFFEASRVNANPAILTTTTKYNLIGPETVYHAQQECGVI